MSQLVNFVSLVSSDTVLSGIKLIVLHKLVPELAHSTAV